jgi:hypothetical protein
VLTSPLLLFVIWLADPPPELRICPALRGGITRHE